MVAIGGKPPPPQPVTGTIYFGYEDMGDARRSLWKMNAADGSGKVRMGAESCFISNGQLGNLGDFSWFTHGGHYWLLQNCQVAGDFPDGGERHEIFAVRDDGGVVVQMTSGLNHEFQYHSWLTWGHDDQFASWFASKWVWDPDTSTWLEIDPGLYRVGITWDANGNPLPITETPTMIFTTYLEDTGYGWQARTWTYDWSPDGSQIVIALLDRPSCKLWVIDIPSLAERCLLNTGNYPVWSPDGAKVAYRCSDGGICIVNIDGSGNKQILTMPKSGWRCWCSYVRWSPDGKHLTYMYNCHDQGMLNWRRNIYRIAIDGSQNTLLTRDLPTAPIKGPVGWR